jgi:hypothetical protein
MNLQERLEQCRKDKAAIENEEQELLEQIEKEKVFKPGDIVKFKRGFQQRRRIILFSEKKGCLAAFNKRGEAIGWSNLSQDYIKTGKNIFTNNLLDLAG